MSARDRVPGMSLRSPLLAAAALTLVTAASAVGPSPPFRSSVTALTPAERAAMTRGVWRPGCPVGPSSLRVVRASHWDFRGRVRTGRLVVHRDVANQVVTVMRQLYSARFPIRWMVPIERFGGSDFRSIEADNTSGFNCRYVDGARRWSEHAYGRAIDINPIENPYVSGGGTSHPASVPFLRRTPRRPGMIVDGDAVTRSFGRAGWGWGGRWSAAKDYQHFSASGR